MKDTAKIIFIENAPLNETVAVKIGEEWKAGVIRKIDGEGNLYAINTRKGSYEKTGRERVEVADAGRSTDAVWCKAHENYKIVTPSGALYCRGCSRTYLKDWTAKKRAGLITAKSPEERAAEREAKQESIKQAAAARRAEELQRQVQQGLRRTEAFFIDSMKRNGESAARSTYSRYLSEERMNEIVAEMSISA